MIQKEFLLNVILVRFIIWFCIACRSFFSLLYGIQLYACTIILMLSTVAFYLSYADDITLMS